MISLETLEIRKRLASVYFDRVHGEMALSKSDLRRVIAGNLDMLIDTCEKYRHEGKRFHFSCSTQLEDDIDKLLGNLKTDIFNTIYLRAENVSNIAYERENQSFNNTLLLALLSSKIAGSTLESRIEQYTRRLKYEIESYIAVAYANNLPQSSIIRNYLQYIDKPYKNQLIRNAFTDTGFKASRLKSKGVAFGNGVYTSAFNGLNMLEKDMIFKTYNHVLQYLWTINGVKGWFTVRGGDFDCKYCDAMIGMFHPILEPYPGYHNNCTCLMIPVYGNDF